jgi:hypothetical protein
MKAFLLSLKVFFAVVFGKRKRYIALISEDISEDEINLLREDTLLEEFMRAHREDPAFDNPAVAASLVEQDQYDDIRERVGQRLQKKSWLSEDVRKIIINKASAKVLAHLRFHGTVGKMVAAHNQRVQYRSKAPPSPAE